MSDAANSGTQFNSAALLTLNIDLPNILAGTTVDVAVATPAGTIEADDRVQFIGAPALTHGLVVQGCHTPGADTFNLRVSNETAGAIDNAPINFDFVVYRRA